MENERGFTLIEMMIVVAIIAILAVILIPNFARARAQAQSAACIANLKTIATALELYYTDNQTYPAAAKQLLDAQYTSQTLKGYLNQVPEDPAAGPGKYYMFTAQNNGSTAPASYQIWCPGSHDPATLQNVAPGTQNTTLEYTSANGVTTAGGQGF